MAINRISALSATVLLALTACNGGSQSTTLPATTQASRHATQAIIPPAPNVRPGCGGPVMSGYARCFDWIRTDISGPRGLITIGSPTGYGPPDLQAAYNIAAASASNGATMTVGIVDSNDDPNAESDLATYRQQYGLPACTTANGCFKKVDQTGGTNYPIPDPGWSTEISLDLDMVSAICPHCHILLVESQLPLNSDLATAVNTAARLGANVISNSYGGSESQATDPAYNHPGIVITASTGDSGYSGGVQAPSSYASVVAVGGTSLTKASNARGWSESAWSGADSGCSGFVIKPTWQKDACANRNVADISAVADPNTGVAVYDTVPYEGGVGWQVVGGTSASSPIIAAVYALAGNAASQNAASGLYSNTALLNDVIGGSNGTCTQSYECNAVTGYDGPTGLGTPNGTAAF